jgi:hypothetical protein
VELAAGELHDVAGAVVPLELRVHPDRVTIPPGEEHHVRVEVDLAADRVSMGDVYHGTVEVTGGDEAVLEVTVEVVA